MSLSTPTLAPPPRLGLPLRPGAGLRWAAWMLYVAAWSAALLTPHPVYAAHALIPSAYQFLCAKALHVTAYALWAVLTAWLPVRGRSRGVLFAMLFGHALASEFFQQFVPMRHGCWADVGIDSAGIVLGLALTCGWWLARCSFRPGRASRLSV
jgi:VanZ family protein